MGRYDHPNALVTRERGINNLTGIASTAMTRFLFHQKAKLLHVQSLVITAGTNASAGVDILNGTTSIGAITHGTDAAGTINESGALDSDISASGYIEIKGKANSATMVNSYTLVYEVYYDAVKT